MSSESNALPASAAVPDSRRWYRQVTREQWHAFRAVFLSWIVASFDFNILAFILIDIQQSYTVDRALAGALGTVTLQMRLVGGTVSGMASDRWGRKLPLMLSLLWLSLFACLSGFLDVLRDALRAACAVRTRHGRRVGGRHAAGVRTLADATCAASPRA